MAFFLSREIHGSYWRARCTRCGIRGRDERLPSGPSRAECESCALIGEKAPLRPDIVWFGELLDPEHHRAVRRFMKAARAQRAHLVFIAIGTSGAVWPAAGFVDMAQQQGAQTWLLNLGPAENDHAFDRVLRGRATELVPDLLGV